MIDPDQEEPLARDKNFLLSRSPSFLPGLADVLEREFMDKDLAIGSVKQIKRAVKQAVCGRSVHDRSYRDWNQRVVIVE